MRRGEVRWYSFPQPNKRRPVVILTRDSALEFLGEVTVAPITSTIRDIPTEVPLSKTDGMPRGSAVNLDHIQTVSRGRIGPLITKLNTEKMLLLRSVLRARFSGGLSRCTARIAPCAFRQITQGGNRGYGIGDAYGVPGIRMVSPEYGVPGIPRHRRDPSVVVDGAVEPPLQNGRVIIRIGSRLEDVSLLWFRIKRVFGGVKYPPGASNRRVVFFASRSGG